MFGPGHTKLTSRTRHHGEAPCYVNLYHVRVDKVVVLEHTLQRRQQIARMFLQKQGKPEDRAGVVRTGPDDHAGRKEEAGGCFNSCFKLK